MSGSTGKSAAMGISCRGLPTSALLLVAPLAMEAYSWGVGEDESGDGLYCGFEGVVRAAVIGV